MRKPDKNDAGRTPPVRRDMPPTDPGSEEAEIDRYIEQVSNLIPRPHPPKPDDGSEGGKGRNS